MDTNKSLLQEEWEASEGNIQTKQKQKLIQKQRRILKQIPRYSNKIQDKRETNTKENSGQTTKVLVCPNPKKAGAMELSVCLCVCLANSIGVQEGPAFSSSSFKLHLHFGRMLIFSYK